MRPLDLRRPWVWTLVVAWPSEAGGEVLRLSSRPVTLTTAAGQAIPFDGGLPALKWKWEAPLYDVAVGQATLSVDVELDDGYALLAERDPLEEHACELSAAYLDGTWEERTRIFVGTVRRAVLGLDGQRATLELIEQAFEDAGVLVDAGEAINAVDFPDAPDDSIGKVPPLVIGTPGAYRSATGAATTPGSPAFPVRITTPVANTPAALLIAGHHVDAASVTVYDATTQVSASRDVVNTSLGTGPGRRLYAYVDLIDGALADFDSASVTATLADDWYIIWDQGGALLTADRTRALVGAGELLAEVLTLSSLPVDRPATLAARAWLDQYQISTYADETISPWEWLRRVLLPLVPVSITSGPDGLYPVAWAPDTGADEAVVALEVGRNCWRASRDEPADTAALVAVSVAFAPDADSGDYQRTITVSAAMPTDDDGDGVTDPDTGTCRYAQAAAMRLGIDSAATAAEELDQVHDADTASRYAAERLQRSWRAGRVVDFDLAPELAGLQQGDVVTLTDDERGWSGRVVRVQAVEWASAYPRASLYVPYQ